MKSMKAKILAVAGVVMASVGTVAAYAPAYTNADIVEIIIDVIGAAGVFIYDNITLIGILMLLGFIVGVFVELKRKSGM